MRISQFQKYSQKENTVTNNVLLMLSRLNDLNVSYYKSIIERSNEGNIRQDYYPQPIFTQQVGMGKGIIDGHIEVKPSKIVIETKLNSKELIGKLIKYGEVFNENSHNQLWHLSSLKFDEDEVIKINRELKKSYPNLNIQFINLLFNDLIENLAGIYEENTHDMELRLLLDDFSGYCIGSDLISNEEYKLLFAPTGFSYAWNKKHKIYYCPTNWHSQKFKYFGLYNSKSVRTISEIETIIIADYDSNTGSLYTHSKGHTNEQKERLQKGLSELGEDHSGLKYYLLPENSTYETDFKKASHGGIQGYRYKDLRDYLTLSDYNDLKLMAEELRKVTWK
ncbi:MULTISPECIES: hypothetical protein [Pseudomonadati]|uniref:Uncharacterized protein n=1 Tax=Shewanella aestuarii TaxID=1028752 RepID=A0ABT0KXM9_9GAMM|nr:hypothetical protein [Shewanella aestuarii]MCL1116196.1 hypothetical protein [Shewanella aestuarii]GGN70929.1 hypothetical protein GCM10009193_06350 [Shewanella aestuarii]